MERFQGTMEGFFGTPDISSAMMTSDENDFHFEYSVLLSLGSRAHMGPIGLLWLSSHVWVSRRHFGEDRTWTDISGCCWYHQLRSLRYHCIFR